MNNQKTNPDLKLLLQQFDHLMQPKLHSKQIDAEIDSESLKLISQIDKKTNKFLFDLYNPAKIANMLEKVFLLELENAFSAFPNEKLGLIDFVTCFLSIVKHKKEHQLFLVSGLIDLYTEITEYNNTRELVWDHFTNFIIENVIESDLNCNVVKSRYVSKTTSVKFEQIYNSSHVNEFAPEVLGGSDLCLRRIAPSKRQNDSNHHNQGIRVIAYAPEMKRVIVQDNITEYIMLYDENSQLKRKLQPNKENHILDTSILYFAYSRTEKRIGCCLQDYSLAFWDIADGFRFEKTFSTDLDVLQVFIKYVEHCGMWITYDQKNVISLWDIERESSTRLPPKHDPLKRIMDICELPHIKLIAVCSLDKQIVFYDLLAQSCVQILLLDTVSAHSMAYAHDFMVLISAGYEEFAQVWCFDGQDCFSTGRLKGHNAQITAVSVLMDTPLAITADEIGFIKTWDLRNLNCVQTIHFESRQPISQFLNINSKMFCCAEVRLHWFEFEDEIKVNANGIEIKNNPPLAIEYNQIFEQLIITTKSDLRLVDMNTGKTSQILANLVSPDEEITNTKLYLNHKNILLTDNRGTLRTHYLPYGQFYAQNQGHSQEITQIFVDFGNKLILTSSWDSSICLQQERQKESHTLRQVRNAHFGMEITCMTVELKHSLIATSSAGVIFMWDYESFKLIGACSNEFEDVHKMAFLFPCLVLISLDTASQIVFWTWPNVNAFKFLKPLYKVSLVSPKGKALNCNQMLLIKLLPQEALEVFTEEKQKITNESKQKFVESFQDKAKAGEKQYCLYMSDEKGYVHAINLNHILDGTAKQKSINMGSPSKSPQKGASIAKGPNQMKRHNYYPFRSQLQSSNGIFFNMSDIKEQVPDHIQMKFVPEINVNDLPKHSWQSAPDFLTIFTLIKLNQYLIVTCNNTSLIRMWSINGDLICVSNMEHPLPYRWRVKVDVDLKRKTKLVNALRVVKEIKKRFPNFKQHEHETSGTEHIAIQEPREQKIVTFAKLLHEVDQQEKETSKANTISLKQMELRKSKRIYAAGTSDDFINSKKNKNLNNTKLFQKVVGGSVKKPFDINMMQEKQGFGPNMCMMEKVQMIFQKDQKEIDNRNVLSKKFDEDVKKLTKNGPAILEKLDPQYATISNPKQENALLRDMKNFRRFNLNDLNESNSFTIKQDNSKLLSHSKSLRDFTLNLNNSKSQMSMLQQSNLLDKEDSIDWLQYAAIREEGLPNILKNQGVKNYLSHNSHQSHHQSQLSPPQKNDSFQIPNIEKRENTKARSKLIQELNMMKKHSKSHFKLANKEVTITDDNSNDQLGIPLFQQKIQTAKNASTSHSRSNLFKQPASQGRQNISKSALKTSIYTSSTQLPSISKINE